MFGLNGIEIAIMVLWAIGLACALTLFADRRGFASALAVVLAAVLPVLGSLLAIGALLLRRRSVDTH